MTKEQRYDPKKEQEKINQARERELELYAELERQVKEGKEASEASKAVREYKARHTDVNRAQVFEFKK